MARCIKLQTRADLPGEHLQIFQVAAAERVRFHGTNRNRAQNHAGSREHRSARVGTAPYPIVQHNAGRREPVIFQGICNE
jgi:hypothetical protein